MLEMQRGGLPSGRRTGRVRRNVGTRHVRGSPQATSSASCSRHLGRPGAGSPLPSSDASCEVEGKLRSRLRSRNRLSCTAWDQRGGAQTVGRPARSRRSGRIPRAGERFSYQGSRVRRPGRAGATACRARSPCDPDPCARCPGWRIGRRRDVTEPIEAPDLRLDELKDLAEQDEPGRSSCAAPSTSIHPTWPTSLRRSTSPRACASSLSCRPSSRPWPSPKWKRPNTPRKCCSRSARSMPRSSSGICPPTTWRI